jgi:hypothetical protein
MEEALLKQESSRSASPQNIVPKEVSTGSGPESSRPDVLPKVALMKINPEKFQENILPEGSRIIKSDEKSSQDIVAESSSLPTQKKEMIKEPDTLGGLARIVNESVNTVKHGQKGIVTSCAEDGHSPKTGQLTERERRLAEREMEITAREERLAQMERKLRNAQGKETAPTESKQQSDDEDTERPPMHSVADLIAAGAGKSRASENYIAEARARARARAEAARASEKTSGEGKDRAHEAKAFPPSATRSDIAGERSDQKQNVIHDLSTPSKNASLESKERTVTHRFNGTTSLGPGVLADNKGSLMDTLRSNVQAPLATQIHKSVHLAAQDTLKERFDRERGRLSASRAGLTDHLRGVDKVINAALQRAKAATSHVSIFQRPDALLISNGGNVSEVTSKAGRWSPGSPKSSTSLRSPPTTLEGSERFRVTSRAGLARMPGEDYKALRLPSEGAIEPGAYVPNSASSMTKPQQRAEVTCTGKSSAHEIWMGLVAQCDRSVKLALSQRIGQESLGTTK